MKLRRTAQRRAGWLVILLGGLVFYVGLEKLFVYFNSGYLEWDGGLRLPHLLGSNATVPYVIYLLLGSWLIGHGLYLTRKQ